MKSNYIWVVICVLLLLAIFLWNKAQNSKSVSQSRIQKESLVEMFEGIKAKTKWDLSKEMLWSYFFIAKDKSRLEKINKRLEEEGYRFFDIHKNELDKDEKPSKDNDFYWLHVEKVEIHTVDSLDKRNTELYQLADEFNVVYDGMDVGPVEKK